MNKIDLILKLIRENKITDEEAKVLMIETPKTEYVPYYPWGWYPTYQQPYTITYGSSGYTTGENTINTFTTSN